MGTCFIIGKPDKNNIKVGKYVLVTADHVLTEMKGDKATVYLRNRVNNFFKKIKWEIQIRNNGKAMWTKHPDADIAVLYFFKPKDLEIPVVPISFLADDDTLGKYEVHPGDTLFALGYPMGQESNDAGFPILRSGIIASYPILPTKSTKTFLFDFEVHRGNSGGPAFLISDSRVYGGGTHTGRIQFLIGLLSQQRKLDFTIRSPIEMKRQEYPLKIGVVVHSSFIKEAIDLLP